MTPGHDPLELARWTQLRPLALDALRFWNVFLGLSRVEGGAQPLADDELERLLAVVRAVSWIVSEHGAGPAPAAAGDPMQCADPLGPWWPQLVEPPHAAQMRIISGNGRRNYWAGELAAAAAAVNGFPVGAAVASLARPEAGHDNPGFTPVMSFIWGIVRLIHAINAQNSGPTYLCADLSGPYLLAGATASVGPGIADLPGRLLEMWELTGPAELPATARVRAIGRAALAAAMPNARNTKLADVAAALAAIPDRSRDVLFSGEVKDKGGAYTHVQGVVACKDIYVLTHSDENENSGRLLLADRSTRALIREVPLPVVGTSPRYFHPGGSQLIGDILVVPSESRKNRAVVSFFDVSNPADIREFDESLRVFDHDRDAAAAGITNVRLDGNEVWVLAVYDSGTVTVHVSPDLPGRKPFEKKFFDKVDEKHHQAMPLLTDTADRVFALGINRGNFPSDDVIVLYQVDLVRHTVRPFPDPSKAEFRFSTPGDSSLRWGTCIDILSESKLLMHCTSKFYKKGCHIGVFDGTPLAPRRAGDSAAPRRSSAAGKARTAAGTRRRTRKR
jgi:hypothetical protein